MSQGRGGNGGVITRLRTSETGGRAGTEAGRMDRRPHPESMSAGERESAGVDVRLLAEMVIALLPSMVLLNLGRPRPAALALFAAVGVFFIFNVIVRARIDNLVFVTGVLPATMLLRNLVWFHSVTALLGTSAILLVLSSRRYMRVLNKTGAIYIGYVFVIYWLLSFMATGEYYRNLRIVEMFLGAVAIVLLANDRRALGTAMIGVMLSMFAIGIALFPHGDRLGMAYVDGVPLGNPITFGLPLALLLFLLTADHSRWLQLSNRPLRRMILTMVVGVLLLLSTSRGSWLVAATGLGLIFFLNRGNRRAAVGIFGIICIAVVIALQTSRGASVLNAVDRTFSEERSLRNRTSGRFDQWMLFPAVMREAPLWGFGPGSGAAVYARFSALSPESLHPGDEMPWHSLYQQIAVEAGYIGVGFLGLLFVGMLFRNVGEWRRSGVVMPMLGTAGFTIIALSVSGMDAASGLYLGFGLLGYAGEGPEGVTDDSMESLSGEAR